MKFDTPDGAEKGLELAVSLQKQQLPQIKDAAIVAWPTGKKQPKTRQHPGPATAGALDGANPKISRLRTERPPVAKPHPVWKPT